MYILIAIIAFGVEVIDRKPAIGFTHEFTSFQKCTDAKIKIERDLTEIKHKTMSIHCFEK